jgi:hypothetical protein
MAALYQFNLQPFYPLKVLAVVGKHGQAIVEGGGASYLSSFTPTEVASHGFRIEITLCLAAAKRALWRVTGRGTPGLLAVTADHRRAKTPDRILRRDERKVPGIGPVPLCALPRPWPGRMTRICPAQRREDYEQRAQSDTKKEKGCSQLDDGQAPP